MSSGNLHHASDSSHHPPRLSVVIASYNSRGTIGHTLESLRHQPAGTVLETIVVDSSTDGTAGLIREKFPEVRLFEFSERKYPGSARNYGISVARGEIIAFIDADCVAGENWAREILSCHQSPHLAIGGAIGNGNPESRVGWAAYLCEFSHWMPNGRPGWPADIAGANMSYKSRAFAEYGRFIEGGYCSDTEFHWRLGRHGHRLRFAPSILVHHRNIESFTRFLSHEYEHGRYFARVRVQGRHFSWAKRLGYALASPLIALKLLIAVGSTALGDRDTRGPFLKSSPLVALGLASWCLGEAAGYTGMP